MLPYWILHFHNNYYQQCFFFFFFLERIPGGEHAVSSRVKLGWEFSNSDTYGKLVVAIRSVWSEKSCCGCFIAKSGLVLNLNLSLHQLSSDGIGQKCLHQLLSYIVLFFPWNHLSNYKWDLPVLCHPFNKLILTDNNYLSFN